MRTLFDRVLRSAAVALAAAALVAPGCSKSGPEEARNGLSVSPASLTFTVTLNGPAPETTQLAVTIKDPDAVYLLAGYPPGDVAPSWMSLWLDTSSVPPAVAVSVRPWALPVGDLHATVRVAIARADESLIGYVDVPVTLSIRPPAPVATPSLLSFKQILGDVAPPARTVALAAEGESASWNATILYVGASGWLRVDGATSASGTYLPASLAVSVTGTTAMAEGSYMAVIRVDDLGGFTDILVFLDVALPTLTVAPTAAAFAAVAGQPALPAAISLDVGAEVGSLDFTTSVAYAGTESGWLSTPVDGATPLTVSLAPTTTLLPPGIHAATLTLSPSNGGAPLELPIEYEVTASQLTLIPTPLAFSVTPTTTAAGLVKSLAVGATGATLDWTATSSVPWLLVTPSDGSSGADVSVAIDPAALESLATGAHDVTLTFTFDGPFGAGGTRTLPVTVDVDLPVIRHVAPYVGYEGRSEEVILRGSGFSEVAGAAVQFGSSDPVTATRVNDTELRVSPPSTLPAGRHHVRVTNGNALGLDRSSADLIVVPATPHTAGLIASAGARRRLVYDAERRCLYAAEPAANVVRRYCDDGSRWVADSVAVSGAADVALTPDGKQLVAINATTLYRIDAASFSVLGSVTGAGLGVLGNYLDALYAVAVTNDGQAIILAGGSSSTIYRLNLARGGPAASLGATRVIPNTIASGMAVSLDGDRVVTGDYFASFGDVFLVYDATDGSVLTPSGGDANSVTLDRAGTRCAAGGVVYDGAFAMLGSTQGWRVTVSPNGSRAYTFVPAFSNPFPALRTFDISGSAVTELGTAVTLGADPGNVDISPNLVTMSLDGGTLFVDGTDGILVMPAP